MPSLKYQPIISSEKDHDEEEQVSQSGTHQDERGCFNIKLLPWIFSTICLFILLAAQSLYYSYFRPISTYESGFATEFSELTYHEHKASIL